MFSEDGPNFGAFNYRLSGFREPPTDHYSRYFWWAARSSTPYCVRNQAQHVIHFDYIETFFEAYRSKPKFGFAFLSKLSHNRMRRIFVARYDFFTLLQNLHKKNLLNDTMLVVMSDHGLRNGRQRTLLQGKLEERLPLLSITLPPWFHKQFPHLVKNLEHNSDLLVTPFDLHATFKHILSYPQPPQDLKRGMSFFDAIPESRTCEEAGVAEHYCPCVRWDEVDKDHRSIKQSARAAVARINSLLESDAQVKTLCARLEFAEVLSAYQKIFSQKLHQHSGCTYQVALRTVPGDAEFEATVTDVDGRFQVSGELSRINLYGDQPKCIKERRPDLEQYCFCKEFVQ